MRSALRIILRDLGLTYVIDDEVLVITTTAEAAARPATRVYSVANLLPADAENAEELSQLVRTLVQQRTPPDGGVPGMVSTYGPLLIVRETEDGHYEVEKLLAQIAAALVQFQQPQPPGSGGNPLEGGR